MNSNLNSIKEGWWKCFVQGITENKHMADEGQQLKTMLSRVVILCYTDCNRLTSYSYAIPAC